MSGKHIVGTIRKLLQLAKTAKNKHEAQVARARAHELMEKHSVHVGADDGDDFQKIVEGVTGRRWREQILAAVGRMYGCRVLRNDIGMGRHVAVLSGPKADVENAHGFYVHVFLSVTRVCMRDWKTFVAQRTAISREGTIWFLRQEEIRGYDAEYDFSDILGERVRPRFSRPRQSDGLTAEQIEELAGIRSPKRSAKAAEAIARGAKPPSKTTEETYAALWFSAYLNCAADAIAKMIDGVVKRPPPPVPYGGGPRPSAKDETDDEIAKFTAELKVVAEKIGADKAQTAYEQASQRGTACPRSPDWIWNWRATKMLMAKSTFPPPPAPNRFNQLDVEELPPQRKPTRRTLRVPEIG